MTLAAALATARPAAALAVTWNVANKHGGILSFLDLDTGHEVTRRATGISPHEVALSPDQRQVVTVSYFEDRHVGQALHVFDIATTEEPRDVIRVDLSQGKVTGVAPTDQTGAHLLALSPDASRAYVTSRGSDMLSVIDTADMATLQTAATDAGPEAVFVSPDSNEVWVGNNQTQNIHIFDTETMDRRDTLDMGFIPIRVRFNRAGDAVAVADLTGSRVLILEPAERCQTVVIDLNAFDLERPPSLLFSPGGAYLMWAPSCPKSGRDRHRHLAGLQLLEAGPGTDRMAFSAVKVVPISSARTRSRGKRRSGAVLLPCACHAIDVR